MASPGNDLPCAWARCEDRPGDPGSVGLHKGNDLGYAGSVWGYMNVTRRAECALEMGCELVSGSCIRMGDMVDRKPNSLFSRR